MEADNKGLTTDKPLLKHPNLDRTFLIVLSLASSAWDRYRNNLRGQCRSTQNVLTQLGKLKVVGITCYKIVILE